MSSKNVVAAAKPPAPAPAAPPPPPAQAAETPGDRWLSELLLVIAAFLRPEYFLTRPLLNTSFDDLLSVWRCLVPAASQPGQLLATLGRTVPLLFRTARTDKTDISLARDESAAYQAAGRMAGTQAKERMQAIVNDQLNGIDDAIVLRLRQGDGRELLLLTDPASLVFKSITNIWIREAFVMAVPLSALPADHPCRSWPVESLYLMGDEPCVILGRPRPEYMPDVNAQPKSYYSLDLARKLTTAIRVQQIRGLLANDVRPDPAKYEAYHRTLERLDKLNRQRPAPTPALPPTAADNRSWAAKITAGIGWFEQPHRAFSPPPLGTAVSHLLAVRQAFKVDDDATHPNRAAAVEFSNLVAGESRHQQLLDLLLPLLDSLDRMLAARVEEGVLWSAMQAARSATR